MIPAGVFAATLVGYADDGALDLDRTGAHYARLRERGIDGLFVGGTTGESFLLDRDERAAIIEHADATLGDFPWIAHVGSMDTTATIELTRLADQTGAAAIAVITPVYFALSAREHAEHFRAVGRETSKPLIAYHIPARSGVQLGPDFFADLAADGVLAGLKYSSTDLYPMVEVIRRAPEGFAVYNGSDEVLTGGLALGAIGGIGSTYTVLPETYAAIYAAAAAGDLTAARAHQVQANTLVEQLQRHNFLAFLRALIERDGVDLGPSRAPLLALDEDEAAEVREWAQRHADLLAAGPRSPATTTT